MQRLKQSLGVVFGVMVGALIVTALTNTVPAQESMSIAFSVSWESIGDFYEDGDQCQRSPIGLGEPFDDAPAALNGFTEVITIRGASGHILAMIPMEGTIEKSTVNGTEVTLCTVTIDASIEPSAGYTVWYEDTYIASIPADGTLGHDPYILLHD